MLKRIYTIKPDGSLRFYISEYAGVVKLSTEPVTSDDIKRTEELGRRLGWNEPSGKWA